MWFISMCLISKTATAQIPVTSSPWDQQCCGCSDLNSAKQVFLFSYLILSGLGHTALIHSHFSGL